jgi:hypothetical protein
MHGSIVTYAVHDVNLKLCGPAAAGVLGVRTVIVTDRITTAIITTPVLLEAGLVKSYHVLIDW